MRCRDVVQLMTDYLDGALAPAVRVRFEEHVAGCAGCAAFLEQLRVTTRVTGALAAVPVPPGLRSELLAAFRDWNSRA